MYSIFVISNGVNTKYFANNRKQSFEQTFYWSNEDNKNIRRLEDFTKIFLEPCHISKMIAKYIVLNDTYKILMVLRPYQYYACEAIVERVKNTNKNGYIWHTTGSGKTLTSFKTSQILQRLPEVDKVLFVVDRKDLDYQTIKEFNSFSKGSIDGTNNTKQLVKQFENSNIKLIVTTLQKLNTAISKDKYLKSMEELKDKKIIFIFDECHRSQFGDTHKRIKDFFNNYQMFGFTGTPILAKNHNNNKTTEDLFGNRLHSYVITDAVSDGNVLKFSVEYIGRYKEKSNTNLDIKVEDIDIRELLESEERLGKIAKYIIDNHNIKTKNRTFNSIFCVSSIDVLIKYYEIFKRLNHNLRIATIFSYGVNEDDKDADGIYDEANFDIKVSEINKHSRDKLEEFIGDYNKYFGTNFSTRDTTSFYNYYKDIAKRTREKDIDILLVVNMFLTGFDSPQLNTLYVDKNLKYHGLIQAFSRTNRILNEQKSQGNIVCFRNLKKETDEAIKLYSNKNSDTKVVIESFETYVKMFNEVTESLIHITPTIDCVDELYTEEERLEFIKTFRNLLRLKNILESFVDFDFSKLEIDEKTFEEYKSKYLDLHEELKGLGKKKVSILNDVDFELELIRRDDINLDYILKLLGNLKSDNKDYVERQKKIILDMIAGDIELRSKRELINKFIEENLANIDDIDSIPNEFYKFFSKEKEKALEEFCKSENINQEKFQELLYNYLYTEKMPNNEIIVSTMNKEPLLLERSSIIDRIKEKMLNFIKIFEE